MKENKEEKKKASKKKSKAAPNKKRSNNKVLKAKEVLARNKAALEELHTKEKAQESISKPRKILRIIKNVFFGIIIAALAVTMITFLIIRMSGGTPTVFGYSIQRVISGSMEPNLSVGDIIVSRPTSSPDDIAIDDIITFKGGAEFEYNTVTHRVVIPPMMNEDGEYVLTTKGDANEKVDNEIKYTSVLSVYVDKVDFLNDFYNFFLSPWGLIIFIAALLFIFFDELLTVVKVFTGNYNEDNSEDLKEIMERLKQEEIDRRVAAELKKAKKLKKPQKYDNTSKKKLKNRKKQKKNNASLLTL